MDLSKLAPPSGARRKRKRVGCGESSGHGKTSCRGGKGQTARTGGKVRAGFEGGQMPLYRRLPKYGFRSQASVIGTNQYSVVNLSALERFEEGSVVDQVALVKSGLVTKSRNRAGVKILAVGAISKKLVLRVNAISQAARSKVEAGGGSVELVK